MNKNIWFRRKLLKGVTIPELLIAVTLITISTPIILQSILSVSKSYTGSRLISEGTNKISNFVQNFKNLSYMSWTAEYRVNADNNGNAIRELTDWSASAPIENDTVFFCQRKDMVSEKVKGWCKIVARPMSLASNPYNLMEIVWYQSYEGTIATPGELGDTAGVDKEQQYLLMQNVQRKDWRTTNREPIFRLFYNNPKNSSLGAAGLVVTCNVALQALFDSGITDSVSLETGVYFHNNEYSK